MIQPQVTMCDANKRAEDRGQASRLGQEHAAARALRDATSPFSRERTESDARRYVALHEVGIRFLVPTCWALWGPPALAEHLEHPVGNAETADHVDSGAVTAMKPRMCANS